MRNFDLEQNISDTNASGRKHSSASWNNYDNTFSVVKDVQNVEGGQNGRSMIEMLGVLAIIGVLSVGGIAGYSKAIQKYRINKTIEQISLIIGNIQTFYVNQKAGKYKYFSIANNEIIKKANLIPEEMLSLNEQGKITKITNIFGGNLTLDTQDYTFLLRLFDIPQDACIELATQNWGITSSGIKGISVGSDPDEADTAQCVEVISETYTSVCRGKTFPMPLDMAINACNCDNDCRFFIAAE